MSGLTNEAARRYAKQNLASGNSNTWVLVLDLMQWIVDHTTDSYNPDATYAHPTDDPRAP